MGGSDRFLVIFTRMSERGVGLRRLVEAVLIMRFEPVGSVWLLDMKRGRDINSFTVPGRLVASGVVSFNLARKCSKILSDIRDGFSTSRAPSSSSLILARSFAGLLSVLIFFEIRRTSSRSCFSR